MMRCGGHDLDWWLDIQTVMEINGIKDAKELEERLNQRQTFSHSKTAEEFIKGVLDHPYGLRPSPSPKLSKPAIGRIVHYITGAGREVPAMIVEVIHPDNPFVTLRVFQKDRETYTTMAEHREEATQRLTWHWPERGD